MFTLVCRTEQILPAAIVTIADSAFRSFVGNPDAAAQPVRRTVAWIHSSPSSFVCARHIVARFGGSVPSLSDHVESAHMANAPKMTTCEVQSGTAWKIISINEALASNTRNRRCVECKMPVRAHRQANNGMAAHFEHLAKSPRCSLMIGTRPAPRGVGMPQHSIVDLNSPPVLQEPVLRKLSGTDPLLALNTAKALSIDDLAELPTEAHRDAELLRERQQRAA